METNLQIFRLRMSHPKLAEPEIEEMTCDLPGSPNPDLNCGGRSIVGGSSTVIDDAGREAGSMGVGGGGPTGAMSNR